MIKNSNDTEKYCSVSVIAKLFNVNYRTVHYHISAGHLKDVKRLGEAFGKPLVVVNRDEAEQYFNSQEQYRKDRRKGVKNHDPDTG
jgi:hypothetical protein